MSNFNSRPHASAAATLLTAAVLLASAPSAFAATQTSTWAGTTTNWNLASNWSPANAIPSNGNAGVSDFNVVVNALAVQPTITATVTIDSLTVATSATVTIGAGITLNIAGPTVTNNGTIQIDILNSNADLNFTANTTISGAGTIHLDDYSPNARITAAANVTFTSGSNQTIDGVGEIDAAFINNGTVNANFNTGSRTLLLQTSNMTNNKVMEATNNGILSISGITVSQGAAGCITNAGGTVNISGASISGGTLSGGEIDVTSSSTFANISIAAATTVVVQGGATLNYTGTTLNNNGTLQLSTLSTPAILNFTANTTISGTGKIMLDTYSPDSQITTAAGVVVTNSAGSTIDGVGTIAGALINNGIINADFNVGTHTINLVTNNMTNNNLLEATGNGTLAISGITVNQGASAVITNAGTAVTISANATISGGSVSGSTITVSNATFVNVTNNATTLVIAAGTVLNYTGATFINNGLVQIDPFVSNGTLNFTGNTTVTGTGSLFLDDYGPNAKITAAAGATVTSNQTIYGVGEIDAALVNNGTVNANFTTGTRTLLLQTSNMTNNNLLEATNTGILSISGITVTQGVSGLISNVSGTVSITNNSIISGGAVSGVITTSNSTFANVKVNAAATVIIQPGTTLNYTGGTVTNNGLIQVDTLSSNGTLNFTGNTTLTGTGSVFLDDYSPNARITGAANTTLTLDTAQTIYGIGEIDQRLVNNGTIIGNISIGSRTLTLNGPTTNNGLIQATNTGIVLFGAGATGSTLSSGTFRIDANSAITVTDTLLTNAATILFTGPGAVFNGIASLTSNTANLTLQSGATTTITGPLTNTGTVSLTGGPTTVLTVTGNYTQSGTGVLSGNGTLVANAVFGNLSTVGGIVRLANNITPATSKLTALTLAGATNAWTGDLDLTINKLIVQDATNHAATLSTLQKEVAFGVTHAAGITSSTLTAKFGIAVVNNASLTTPFSTFGGLSVDSNSILVAPELLGDADISGHVDLTDLNIVLNHLGATTPNWTDGNFDNAATIDLTDLNDVLNGLGTSFAGSSSVLAAEALLAAGTPAPEPASLALLAIAPVLLAGRRRRL